MAEAKQPSKCLDEWKPQENKVNRTFTDAKARAEKKHLEANPSGSLDNQEIGVRTFIDIHNRKSLNEYKQEERMGTKKRV